MSEPNVVDAVVDAQVPLAKGIQFLSRTSQSGIGMVFELSQEEYCPVTASLNAKLTSAFRMIDETGV